MENMKNAIRLVGKNDYMASIDIKDAYFLIPMSKRHKKYLRFQFHGIRYEFQCVPFGLSVSPYLFTKLLKPVVEKLRLKGFKSVVYLDDFLLLAKTEKKCAQNVEITSELLISLGFILNTKKCQLKPEKKCKFLGFIIDSEDYSIYLTNEKREKIMALLNKMHKLQKCKILDIARLIGTLIAACPGVKYGWLHTKKLEMDQYLALKSSKGKYDKIMEISPRMEDDIFWWMQNISTAKNPIRNNVYKLEIFTDASLTGWGASC
ncbi:hypothetical protein TKK_0010545 [Trichogramma kaykai]